MRMPGANKSVVLCLLLAGMVCAAQGQPRAAVVIETNYPEALVYADSLWLGYASQGTFFMPMTVREIRLVAQEENGWNISPVVQPVELIRADSTYRYRLNFPYYYQIRTVPFDAVVYLEQSGERWRIGETPVLYRSEVPLSGVFRIEHPGYLVQQVDAGSEIWNDVEVMLHSGGQEHQAAEIAWRPPRQSRTWIDYAALGLAVGAGVAAIHYKFKADDLYDQYRETGDPDIRSRVKRYDVQAGISLGAMQVGMGVFAIRLLLRR